MKKNSLFFSYQRKTREPAILKWFMISLFFFIGINNSYSQEKVIKLDVKNATLPDVFLEIENQSSYRFFFSNLDLKNYSNLEFKISESDINKIVTKILENTDLIYRVEEDVIYIKKKKATGIDESQFITISGTVTDEFNEPLPGVSIRIKGGNFGTVTDNSGNYKIGLVKSDNIILVFSFVGMEQQEVPFKNNHTINVKMKEEVSSIGEVVVTGYQTIRKSEMVGSSSSIKRDELFYDGTNSIEQMLQGKLPGLLVMNVDGKVGTRNKVRVRGTSTLLGNQEPVWVVDGIIQDDPIPFKSEDFNSFGQVNSDNIDMIRNFIGNNIAWLSPNDIDEITVLKDASATVLYGVKAANGVIVITTKKGTKGRISVNYSGGTTFSDRISYKKLNLMNSKERIDVSREIYEKRLYGTRYTEKVGYEYALSKFLNKEINYQEFDDEVKRLESVNTDWFNILYRNPVSHNHSISFSGGTDMVSYYGSISYNQNIGTANGNDSESYGALLNIDTKLNSKVLMSMSLAGNYSKTNGFYQVDPYDYAISSSRAIPCFDEEGDLFFYENKASSSSVLTKLFNVLNELKNTGNKNEVQTLKTNIRVKYDVIPGFSYEMVFGAGLSSTTGESYATERSNYITKLRGYEYGEYGPADYQYKASQLPHGGEINISESRSQNITLKNSISYNQVFNEKHRFSFLLGQEIRSNIYKGESNTSYGYFPERGKSFSPPPIQIETTSGIPTGNSIYNTKTSNQIIDRKTNFVSYYGSTTYSFNECYVLTGSLRSDASNRFGQDKRHRYLPVWSIGARWNTHNENWMINQNVISELNFRASYGWQGNVAENFSPNIIATLPYDPIDSYTGEFILKLRSLAYGDLRWEKTKTINLGIDMGFFSNRFMFTLEYYQKKTEDLIVTKQIPVSYGTTSLPVNAGDMLNRGVELTLTGTLIRKRNIHWNMTLNSSKNFNRIDTDLTPNGYYFGAVNGTLHKKGYPVSSIWAFKYKGPNPETGLPEFEMQTAEENPAAINDVTEVMKHVGKLEPDFSGGLSTNFTYKSVTLSGSFNLNIGGKKFLYRMFATNNLPTAYENLPKEFVNRWRKPGNEKFTRIPTIPSSTASGYQHLIYLPSGQQGYLWSLYNFSEDRVVNASFLRCNNLSLIYNLSSKLAEKILIKNLSISASVSNPFIIVSKGFKGMDPEVATGNQPITRNYSFSLNIGF